MSATAVGLNRPRLPLSCTSEQDDVQTNSSILDFLNQEHNCLNTEREEEDFSELDIDSIFSEINRLSEQIDETRSVDEILQEAETLLSNQAPIQLKCIAEDFLLCDDAAEDRRPPQALGTMLEKPLLSDQKHLSQESTPRDMVSAVSHSKSESQIANNKKPLTLERSNSRNGDKDKDYPSSLRNTPDSAKLMNSQAIMSPLPRGMSPALTLDDIQIHQQPPSMSSSIYSPTNSYARERALESEITSLQEKLKDAEERYHSLRIQYDTLSVQHRDLREQQGTVQDETEKLRRDVKHLNDCAAILRSELQIAREDRQEAIRLQTILKGELTESRSERKKFTEQTDRDSKTILDLQRQCKEMERILMRKHPDSVSALIVAAKGTTNGSPNGKEDGAASRKLLEQRIMQLEQDAKEQDSKAQKILSNVQTKFSAIQAKYETHIADLETQVLSLQDINTKLNSKIVQLTETIDQQRQKERDLLEAVQQSAAAKSTEKTSSRGTQTVTGKASNLPRATSSSSANKSQAAEHDSTQLMAMIRGMRVDLAIKEKALQRLTRELDECKKTIRKLKEMSSKIHLGGAGGAKKPYDPLQFTEKVAESVALKEAHHKLKLLEFDYKALHDKRLQDLKTLQAAHERELASCQETVRILQQRLAEGDEAQKQRRRVPVDYYALKAKVTCLEQRHSEREDRLHMLVEALSKGRLNGIIDETFLKKSTVGEGDNGSGSEPSVSPNSD